MTATPAAVPEAWNGMSRCRRPATGRARCEYRKPHRHCECGDMIDLDHGYCDDCFAALIRGAAMTKQQSEAQFETREAWLIKYGFVQFSPEGIRVFHG